MDYSKMLAQKSSGIEKSVQKAILCINNMKNDKKNASQSMNAAYAMNTAFAVEKAFRKQGADQGTFSQTAARSGYKLFEVQFNPTEISFSSGKRKQDKDEDLKKMKKNPLNLQTSHTMMTIPLIFDNTDSVKIQIDGLTSLLSNAATRNIVFCWGKIALSGILQSVQTEYNMFAPSGSPIRGTVTLQLALNYGAEDSSSRQYWHKAFEGLFKAGTFGIGEKGNGNIKF